MVHHTYSIITDGEGLGPNERILRELDFPAARLLAELNLTRHTANEAMKTLALLYERYSLDEGAETGPNRDIIAGCLFRDSIVQFVGCFGKAKKGQLTDEIYAAESGGLEYLQWLRDLRNSYAAHAHGPQRQSSVSALPDRQPGEDVIHFGLQIYQGPERDALPDMIEFIRVGIAALDEQIKTVTANVIAQINLMPPEAIKRLPAATFTAPHPGQLNISRSAFRSTLAGSPPQGRPNSNA